MKPETFLQLLSISALLMILLSPTYCWSTSRSLHELVKSHGNMPGNLLLSPGNWEVSDNLEVPGNIRLKLVTGSIITIAKGKKLVLHGSFDAPLVQIFAGSGHVIFDANSAQSVYPQWWGAKGDGATNDTGAFAAVASAVNEAGGGHIVIPKGKYIVGSQIFAGAKGLGFAYKPDNILWIKDCARSVIIEGHGAVVKAAAGLKIGSFDPLTGKPVGKSTNPDERADAYWGMIRLENNKGGVNVRNLELDGNVSKAMVGGPFGDSGYQVGAHGIYAYGNNSVNIENVYSHHHGTDGIIVGYAGLTDASRVYPHTLRNVICEYNGRQGLSWVGGNALTVIESRFNHTGKNGVIASAPGAGVDIEAESAINRNGLFINCEMVNNTGPGMVADSGDSKNIIFNGCTFWGTTNWSVWPRKPNIHFVGCKLYGSMCNVYTANNHDEGTVFESCEFEDKTHPLYGVYRSTYLIEISDGRNTTFNHCTFKANYVGGGYIVSFAKNIADALRVTNSTWLLKNDKLQDQSPQIVLAGVYIENVTINESYENSPRNGYYIAFHNEYVWVGENCTVTGEKTFWGSWSPGAGGRLGLAPTRKPLH